MAQESALEPDQNPDFGGALRRILAAGSVFTCFQPLVSLRTQKVLGLEALSRGQDPLTGQVVPPLELFAQVQTDAEMIALDRLCRQRALEGFRDIRQGNPDLILSLNFEGSLLDRGVKGSGHIYNSVRELNLPPNCIVIEIVESKVNDHQALVEFTEIHRAHGFLLALDDVGAGHSNLERIHTLKPDVLKIDRSLITGLDHEFHQQEVARALMSMAQKIGALVVAEGVEREAEALITLEMGVDILQGFLFGRPGQPQPVVGQARQMIGGLARRFRDHTINSIAAKKAQHARYNGVVEDLVAGLYGKPLAEMDQRLKMMIPTHPGLECLYVLDRQGIQISETVCDPLKLISQRKHIFKPAARESDLSLKDYYMLLMAGLNRYVSEPYISRASGSLCITISTWFKDDKGAELILCSDFACEIDPG